MMWIVAKAESRFNTDQDQLEYRAIEVVHVSRTETEAEQCCEICSLIAEGEFTYIVINNYQIGEWVR